MDITAVAEYDGTDYFGFQVQPYVKTVQLEIERVLETLYKERVKIRYTSRTDRGVHSKGQVISFSPVINYEPKNLETMLNSRLPDDIIVRDVINCAPGFNPRYAAVSKTYTYRILNSDKIGYMDTRYMWHITGDLDWSSAEAALKLIQGEHEFKLFASETASKITVIKVIETELKKEDGIHCLKIKAPYFLTYMIRYLVGYIIAIAKGKKDIDSLHVKLEGQGSRSSYCAPPHGLELTEVQF